MSLQSAFANKQPPSSSSRTLHWDFLQSFFANFALHSTLHLPTPKGTQCEESKRILLVQSFHNLDSVKERY